MPQEHFWLPPPLPPPQEKTLNFRHNRTSSAIFGKRSLTSVQPWPWIVFGEFGNLRKIAHHFWVFGNPDETNPSVWYALRPTLFTVGMKVEYCFPSWNTRELRVSMAVKRSSRQESRVLIIGWMILDAKSVRSRDSLRRSKVSRAHLKGNGMDISGVK